MLFDPISIEAPSSMTALWLLSHAQETNAQYHYPLAFNIKGRLEKVILESCILKLIQNHPALRLNLELERGALNCKFPSDINNCKPLPTYISLLDFSEKEKQSQLNQIYSDFDRQLFQPNEIYSLKAHLIQLKQQEHILLLNVHHISVDAWSMGLLIKELGSHYCQHLINANNRTLIQDEYINHLQLKRQRKNISDKTDLLYWKNLLGSSPPYHSLPRYPNTSSRVYICKKYTQNLSNKNTQILYKYATKNRMTLYMLIQPLFAMSLALKTNMVNVITGTPVARRMQNRMQNRMLNYSLENCVGYISNLVCIKNTIDINNSIADNLEKNREVILEALMHQGSDFADVISSLNPLRMNNRTPFIQILFTHNNIKEIPLVLGELETKKIFPFETKIRFELEVEMISSTGGLTFNWSYNNTCLSRSTIQNIAVIFMKIITGLIKGKSERISIKNFI